MTLALLLQADVILDSTTYVALRSNALQNLTDLLIIAIANEVSNLAFVDLHRRLGRSIHMNVIH